MTLPQNCIYPFLLFRPVLLCHWCVGKSTQLDPISLLTVRCELTHVTTPLRHFLHTATIATSVALIGVAYFTFMCGTGLDVWWLCMEVAGTMEETRRGVCLRIDWERAQEVGGYTERLGAASAGIAMPYIWLPARGPKRHPWRSWSLDQDHSDNTTISRAPLHLVFFLVFPFFFFFTLLILFLALTSHHSSRLQF